MLFTVVTPVFNGRKWIELCLRSVADQPDQSQIEHIVQDGGSSDGTQECCQSFSNVHLFCEKDNGMYDAINRGFRKAQGEFILHLNSDEQLLPRVLPAVVEHFRSHPNIDILFAYALVTDPSGKLICYRKTLLPTLNHTLVSHLCTLTAATFYRRSAIEKYGLYFDTSYRISGDGELIARALKQNVSMGILPVYTSSFTMTGSNLSYNPKAVQELARLANQAPWWARKGSFAVKAIHRIRRLLNGVYSQKALDYDIYTATSPGQRQHFHVEKPDFRWREQAQG